MKHVTVTAPSKRTKKADPVRLVAFEVLQAVSEKDAYANLVLPRLLQQKKFELRDAGFATELTYGTLRGQGSYDAILAKCSNRVLSEIDVAVCNILRLGVHQLLSMRVPSHAAVDQCVALTYMMVGRAQASFVNAVLRKVSQKSFSQWVGVLVEDEKDLYKIAALEYSHPEWVVKALQQALVANGRDAFELNQLLEANNISPVVNLVALPGVGNIADVVKLGGVLGSLVAGSALWEQGNLGAVAEVVSGKVRVQDFGSQLVALALAKYPLQRSFAGGERWLDLCAGPGGKAALLAACAAEQGAYLVANEVLPHRAQLVRQALQVVRKDVWEVRCGDGRDMFAWEGESFARVLVDAPCTGLGALRRRAEARWRRNVNDLSKLSVLQRELFACAVSVTVVGGIIAYVTCSPHVVETHLLVCDVLKKYKNLELLDSGAAVDVVSLSKNLQASSSLSFVDKKTMSAVGVTKSSTVAQLWTHVHKTDSMFIALFKKVG